MEIRSGLTTEWVFAVFYAILFGGILGRLSVWSPFSKHDDREKRRVWVPRFFLSQLFFTIIPALYLAAGLWVAFRVPLPQTYARLCLWAVLIFMSTLFLNACYRFWVGLIVHWKLYPPLRPVDAKTNERGSEAWITTKRYVDLGVEMHLQGGLISFVMSVGALVLLWFFFQ